MKTQFFSLLYRQFKDQPKAFYLLMVTELSELFGRFGIFALLVLYLTKSLHFSDGHAFSLFASFTALMFIAPLIGGYLADRFIGHRMAIIIGILTMAAGNFLVALGPGHTLYVGLATIIIGFGLFNPTLAAMLGSVYDNNKLDRDNGFMFYIICKNTGGLLAAILLGLIAQHYGYNVAFFINTLAMLLGLSVFIINQKTILSLQTHHKLINLKKPALISVNTLLIAALLLLSYIILTQHFTGDLLAIISVSTLFILLLMAKNMPTQGRKNLIAIVLFTLMVTSFYTFLNLGGQTLNLFIERLVDRHIFNITIPTPIFYGLEQIYMLILGPLLTGIFMILSLKGKPLSACTKSALGIFFLAIGFAIFVVGASVAMHFGKVSMLVVIIAYMVFALAELSIAAITLSRVTMLAPPRYKSMMVGVYMLGLGMASYLSGKIAQRSTINFDFHTLAGRQHAAMIYHSVFVEVTIGLLISGVIVLALVPVMKSLTRASITQ